MLHYCVVFTSKANELQTKMSILSFRTILSKGTFKNPGMRRNQESTKIKCRRQQIRMGSLPLSLKYTNRA